MTATDAEARTLIAQWKSAGNADIGDGQVSVLPIRTDAAADPEAVQRLAAWRNRNADWFMSRFVTDAPRTRAWLRSIASDPLRILFWIEAQPGRPVGLLGLSGFSPDGRSCALESVMRGEASEPRDAMTRGLRALLARLACETTLERVWLRVFSDAASAIALYRRCGFMPTDLEPLRYEGTDAEGQWLAQTGDGTPRRFNLIMEWRRPEAQPAAHQPHGKTDR
ncbi:MAG: GNAT family N-acetyltransferase [Alphaproteobacteria bacterium]